MLVKYDRFTIFVVDTIVKISYLFLCLQHYFKTRIFNLILFKEGFPYLTYQVPLNPLFLAFQKTFHLLSKDLDSRQSSYAP